jgi:2'-5' RNA ligase superfamily
VALALCLLFDRRTDRLVTQLWGRLEAQGVSTLLTHTHGLHRPHLSYAVLRDGDLGTVRSAVTALPDGGPLEVVAQGSVVFPRGRVALACAAPADVVARQERVVAALSGEGIELHRNYEPGRWVPHVSVATSASARQLSAVVGSISDVLPLPLRAVRAAIIETATGELWPLPALP